MVCVSYIIKLHNTMTEDFSWPFGPKAPITASHSIRPRMPYTGYLAMFHICRYCPKRHKTLLWRHNGRDGVSNHQPHDCLLNRSFRRWSKKTSKLRVTDLCAGNSPVTGEFPAQMASNATDAWALSVGCIISGNNVSIWWRHHGLWI